MKQKGNTILTVLLGIIVFGALGGVAYVVWSRQESSKTVIDYATCAQQKDAKILETYPEQCVFDGQTFTNPNQKFDVTNSASTAASVRYYDGIVPDGWKHKECVVEDATGKTYVEADLFAPTEEELGMCGSEKVGVVVFRYDAGSSWLKPQAQNASDKTYALEEVDLHGSKVLKETRTKAATEFTNDGSTTVTYYARRGDATLALSYYWTPTAPKYDKEFAQMLDAWSF